MSNLDLNSINTSIRLKRKFTVSFKNWDEFKSNYFVLNYSRTPYGYRINKAKAR